MENIYRKRFADRMLKLMNGKSILELSIEIGISAGTINSWIKQKTAPKIKHLTILAEYFNCTIDYLVGRKDEFGNKI